MQNWIVGIERLRGHVKAYEELQKTLNDLLPENQLSRWQNGEVELALQPYKATYDAAQEFLQKTQSSMSVDNFQIATRKLQKIFQDEIAKMPEATNRMDELLAELSDHIALDNTPITDAFAAMNDMTPFIPKAFHLSHLAALHIKQSDVVLAREYALMQDMVDLCGETMDYLANYDDSLITSKKYLQNFTSFHRQEIINMLGQASTYLPDAYKKTMLQRVDEVAKTLALTVSTMDDSDESQMEGLRKKREIGFLNKEESEELNAFEERIAGFRKRFEVLANRTLDMRSDIQAMNEKSGKQFHAERFN